MHYCWRSQCILQILLHPCSQELVSFIFFCTDLFYRNQWWQSNSVISTTVDLKKRHHFDFKYMPLSNLIIKLNVFIFYLMLYLKTVNLMLFFCLFKAHYSSWCKPKSKEDAICSNLVGSTITKNCLFWKFKEGVRRQKLWKSECTSVQIFIIN